MWPENNAAASIKRDVVPSGGRHCALAADKFHPPALPNLFDLSQQDAADLPRVRDVRSTAGGQIEIPEYRSGAVRLFPFSGRLAQSEILRRLLA